MAHVSMFLIVSSGIDNMAFSVHVATDSQEGGWKTAVLMPRLSIQSSQKLWILFFEGLEIPMSTGWHNPVHPPGMCSTWNQTSFISFITTVIMWQW